MPRYTTPTTLERLLARHVIRGLPVRDYSPIIAENLHESLSENEKSAGVIANEVLFRCKLAELSQDELNELSRDLQEQMLVRGPEAAQQVLPQQDIQKMLKAVRRESSRQTLMGLAGGAAGGVIGGLGGALTSAITRGREHALPGALMGVLPGGVAGYLVGSRTQQQKELADLLRDKIR